MLSASISATASGNTQVIAAPSTGFIRIHSYDITALTALNEVQFRDGASTVKTRCNSTTAGGGISKSFNVDGYFDCSVGNALNVNLSASSTVGVNVTYSIRGS